MGNATHIAGKRHTLMCVWVCALVLVLLTFVSASGVGAYAAPFASRDPQVLFIDTVSGNEVTDTMDLFQSAYVNEKGETVVASSDGTKVVAPGTSGTYEFAVRNSGGQPATYRVWAETSQNGTTQIIPLQVSLKSGRSACEDLSDSGQLDPSKSAIYSIAWQWPFEQGDSDLARTASNESDTNLGDKAAAHRVSYKVTLHMTAEADYPAKASKKHMPGTGDAFRPAVLLALIALGVVLVLAGIGIHRRSTRGSGR